MKRIFIVVEGSTEERFVRQVLYPHFILKGIHVEAQQWMTNRKLGTTGGGNSYDYIENHVNRLMSRYKNDKDVFFTVMVDLYGFPKKGNTIYVDDEMKKLSSKEKSNLLMNKMEARFSNRNFIPYVQLHEFEALLLSSPDALCYFYTDNIKEINLLKNEIKGMSPEEINETPKGAPSKRIAKYLPSYLKLKATAGVITASSIGLPILRAKCPNFDEWISKIENL